MSSTDDRAPQPADAVARLAAMTAERDAALAASYRQRERLQAEIDRAHRWRKDKDAQLRRTRLELDKMRRRFAFRAQRKIESALSSIIDLTRRGSTTPPPTVDVVPGGDTGDLAGRFRDVMTDRLSGTFAISDEPVRVAVVRSSRDAARADDVRDEVGARLSEFGMVPSTVDGLTDADIGDAIDIAVLRDPTSDIDRLPRHVIRVAWVGDRPDPWLSMPRFDDLDIVLVGDEATRTRVEVASAKSASVAADPGTPSGAQAFRDAVLRWVAAPHVAIHIGPETWDAAAFWGDTPFGRGVQKAFERRGWPATVHVVAEEDSAPATRADLAIHVFGIGAPVIRPWQTSVLWIISHPDMVTRETCMPYDLIAVASDRFLDYLRGWLGPDGPPLLALHQATDPDRFHPEAGGPPHELLFVGNSRYRRRAILDALAGTTHDLAVYGRNWTADLLDVRNLRGDWIPNDELRRYYSSAAIVLNDSYPDMRDEGFIANRVYDALASGAFVISEAVPGMDEEFDDAVVTFRDRVELLDRIDHFLARPDERMALAEKGRRAVLGRHTFDHRVGTLMEAVAPLLADRPPDHPPR